MASASLSPRDLTRLVGVLGMLGSDHVGERAAAALAASRMVRNAGLTWGELLQPRLDGPGPPPPPPPPPPPGWHEMVTHCQAHPDQLTQWENDFLRTLARRGTASHKQIGVLVGIAERLARS